MNELITVLSAELMRRLRSRFFIVGLLLGALGVGFTIVFPNYIAKSSITKVALGGDPDLVARAKPLLKNDFTIWSGTPENPPTAKFLDANDLRGAVFVQRAADGLHIVAYAKDPSDVRSQDLRRDLVQLNLELATHSSPARVLSLIKIPVDIRSVGSKFGTLEQSQSARTIAYLLVFLLYLLIALNSQFIMSSVAEEKTSRIAELLVATVNPSTLLAAKVGASIVLALIQMATWTAVAMLLGNQYPTHPQNTAVLGGADNTTFSLAGVTATDLIAFALFFIIGYVQMSMLFASVGSLVNRTEDLGGLAFPVLMPTLAGFFIATSALALPDALYVKVASFIPLLSPYVMFTRMVVSTVPLWQVAISVLLNLLAIWGIAILAGKLYRIGMLLYGRSPSIGQIWKVLRT